MARQGTSVVDFAWNPIPAGGFDLYDLDVQHDRGPAGVLQLHLVRGRKGSRNVWTLLWWSGSQDGAGIWMTHDRSRTIPAESRYAGEPIEQIAQGQWGSREAARRLVGIR